MIQRKTEAGRKPAYLFLGRREADLLRRHLGIAIDSGSVPNLIGHRYAGLKVVDLETDSYLRTARKKRVEGLVEALDRQPGWHELEASSFWVDAVR